jgi:hypothetical protein
MTLLMNPNLKAQKTYKKYTKYIDKWFTAGYIYIYIIFSHFIDQHFKHLHKFFHTVKQNELVVSKSKNFLFQTRIRFLGYYICQDTMTPIERSLSFTNKFPDKIYIYIYIFFWSGRRLVIHPFKKQKVDDALYDVCRIQRLEVCWKIEAFIFIVLKNSIFNQFWPKTS